MVDRPIVLVFVGPGILKIKISSQKFLSRLSVFLNLSRIQKQCSEMNDFSFPFHPDWQSFQDNKRQQGSINCLSHSCHYSNSGKEIFSRNMRKISSHYGLNAKLICWSNVLCLTELNKGCINTCIMYQVYGTHSQVVLPASGDPWLRNLQNIFIYQFLVEFGRIFYLFLSQHPFILFFNREEN